MTGAPVTTCANCGERLCRATSGAWRHTYTISETCRTGGKKAMPRKEAT